MCVCLVTQTLCGPMDCSSPGFSVHEILQAKILEWVAIPFSRGSSWPRGRTLVLCIAGMMPESQPRDSDSYLVKVAGIVKVNMQPGLGVTAFRQAFQPDKLSSFNT